MNTEHTQKRRPYWHVDMKWIFGILLFFSLSAALLFYSLSVLTQRDNATTMSATILAGLFSKDGMNAEGDIAELKRNADALPGDAIVPLPQFPGIEISKQDLNTKSPAELKISFFRQITEKIYDNGVVGAAESFTKDKSQQDKFASDAVLLGGFTKSAHDAVQGGFIVSVLVSTVLMGIFIFFSAGWGRIANPGALLLLVSPVGALLGLLLTKAPNDGNTSLVAIPANVGRQVGESLNTSYGLIAIIGAGLIVFALIGKIAHVIYKRSRKSDIVLDK